MKSFVQKVIFPMMVMVMGLVTALPLQARLTEVDWNHYNYFEPEGPGTYSFGYDIEDAGTNNVQFRNEERLKNGTVVGSYGFVDEEGWIHTVNYVADHLGYRASMEKTRRGQLKPILLPETPPSTVTAGKPVPFYQTSATNKNYAIVTQTGERKPPYYVSNVLNSQVHPENVQKKPTRKPIWQNFNENVLIDNYYH